MNAELIARVRGELTEESRKRGLVHLFAWWPDGFWWTLPVSAELFADWATHNYIVSAVAKDLVARDRDLLDAEGVEEIHP